MLAQSQQQNANTSTCYLLQPKPITLQPISSRMTSSKQSTKIAIIGGGLGGLPAAITLGNLGYDGKLFLTNEPKKQGSRANMVLGSASL
jgi:heterodisulfide reductase subunit A-like polyferredoxin